MEEFWWAFTRTVTVIFKITITIVLHIGLIVGPIIMEEFWWVFTRTVTVIFKITITIVLHIGLIVGPIIMGFEEVETIVY